MSRTSVDKGNGRGRSTTQRATVTEPIAEVQEAAESGRAAFLRIAEKRINGIIEKLNTLSKMASGKSKYGYTDKDVEQIRSTLTVAVNASCDRLRRKPIKEGFKFERGLDAGA